MLDSQSDLGAARRDARLLKSLLGMVLGTRALQRMRRRTVRRKPRVTGRVLAEMARNQWHAPADMKTRSAKTNRWLGRSAFTMVELLIAISVLGTVAAIALPNVNRTVRQRRVIAAAAALSRDMESAFSLASRQRRPIRVSYDAASGAIRIVDRASGTVYRSRAVGATSEYHLTAVSISPPVVDLFPTGLGSAAFSISLTNGGYQRQVAVTRTGLARVLP